MIDTPWGLACLRLGAGKWFMAQLSLFSRSKVASWRDWTASRNYSQVGEQFRLEHARPREWGLQQRLVCKAMYLRIYGYTAASSDRVGDGVVSCPAASASVSR